MALPRLTWNTHLPTGTGAHCSSAWPPVPASASLHKGSCIISSHLSSLESVCSRLPDCGRPWILFMSFCAWRCRWSLVPALQDCPPWVRITPTPSWICCSPTVSCCALDGGEGGAVCEPQHYTGINLGKRAGGHPAFRDWPWG